MFRSFFSNSNPDSARTRRRLAGRERRLNLEKLELRTLMAGDVVIDWDNVMLQAIRVDKTNPPKASRFMAIVSTSVYDAVNSIVRTHESYAVQKVALPTTSVEAAAAGAAWQALVLAYPAQKPTFDAALATSLAAIPDGPSEDQGVALGKAVANEIWASRASDGSAIVVPYTPGIDPGEWRPTPPAFAPALLPGWGNVTPFAMISGDQFHVDGVPDLTSVEYADALNEVKAYGAAVGSIRTPDQSNIALFWNNGAGTATPPGHLNIMAQQAALSEGNSVYDNARMFAMLNIALADAAISCWENKFTASFWRPVTAIRLADTDGNPATSPDTTWSSFITTPPFPTYTSGHSTFSGAAAAVLGAFFGRDDIAFTLKSEAPGVPDRSYFGFTEAAAESAISRMYGGIHYSFDDNDGLAAGLELGQYIGDNFLGVATSQPAAGIVDGTLVVLGTERRDVITVDTFRNDLRVTIGNKSLGTFPGATSIMVLAGAGNDMVSVAPRVLTNAWLYGGLGNDYILGGNGGDHIYGEKGKDILFGRLGHDLIEGGDDDDLLHGGYGSDELHGGLGKDIMVGGGKSPDIDTLFQ